MSKEIKFGQEARAQIMIGIDKVANAVKSTLGPRGRNVIFKSSVSNNATVTNDGVTIAKEIKLKDNFEDIGASLVKEAAIQTNEEAGDGTTTATLLVQAIASNGLKKIDAGNNAMLIRKGIEKGVAFAVNFIQKLSKDVTTKEEKKYVATISSGDEEIGEIVADAMEKVGKDGVITIENSNKFHLESEVVQGMLIEKGYLSPYMVNQNSTKAVLDNPFILITDQKLSSSSQIVPVLEKINTLGTKSLLIISGGMNGEALATAIVNNIRGGFNIVGVEAPEYGDLQKEILEDVAVLTGGQFISESKGIKYDDLVKSNIEAFLGKSDKVTSEADKTIIVGGKGDVALLNQRIERIETILAEADNEYAKDQIKKRIAKLKGGIGVIRVGAATQVEAKEKLYKVEDALNATRAAVEEGIIPGGGVALMKAKMAMDEEPILADDNEQIGFRILANALEAPIRQILLNAGIIDIDTIIAQLKSSKQDTDGFNFKNIDSKKDIALIDAITEGVVDPTKVTRVALQNAASVASSLCTTEVIIVEEEEVDTKDKK